MNLEMLRKSGWIIGEFLSGSRAYNIHNDASDWDYRGIFMPPASDVSIFDLPQEVKQDKCIVDGKETEIKFFSLRKYMLLASGCNPAVIELMFQPEDTVVQTSPAMQMLVANRHLFVSTRAEVTFGGFAHAQIEKCRGQNKLINNPCPKEKPSKEQFCYIIPINLEQNQTNSKNFLSAVKHNAGVIDLTINKTEMPMRPIPLLDTTGIDLSKFRVAALEHVPNTYRLYYYGDLAEPKGVFRNGILVNDSISMEDEKNRFVGILIYNDHAWDQAMKKHKEYWSWVEMRNTERWQRQETGELSFDVKNVCHCLRALYSGIHLLKTGEPLVRISGSMRDFLLEVRAGQHKYEFLMAEAERLLAEIKTAKEESKLPYEANMQKIDRLYKEIYHNFSIK